MASFHAIFADITLKMASLQGKREADDHQIYPQKSLKNCINQNIREDIQQENSVRS